MRIAGISYPDVNNGLGCRVTLWTQGCSHHCKGCHNPETWSFSGGKEFDGKAKEELFSVLAKSYIKGLTLSGGDPMDSYDDILALAKETKEKMPEKDIWMFTGYKLDDFINGDKGEILSYVDVIVDGEYKEELRDVSLPYRGSSNQHIWERVDGGWKRSELEKAPRNFVK